MMRMLKRLAELTYIAALTAAFVLLIMLMFIDAMHDPLTTMHSASANLPITCYRRVA